MSFCVARLRRLPPVLLLLVFAPLANSREESLFTSSVSYCSPPQSLLIQQFDVAYIAANSSVFFNVSAASVEPNLNVTANLLLNVYGMSPLNLTIDLCSILNGALCPLPTYNFTGSQSIMLPSSINVASDVPGIAYKIPDLEAFAQLTLVERGTGELKACVQSTLANGWSTRQTAVEWSTGAVALLALLSALWQSLTPQSLALFRFLDLFYLYQTIATSGLLNINYPLAYRSYTLNFSWAIGLFSSSASSRIQNAIDRMRHLTGGTLADANGGSAIDLVNRKLSPYNIPSSQGVEAFTAPLSLIAKARALPQVDLTQVQDLTFSFADVSTLARRDVATVATVTNASPNVLQAGVPVYVNSLGIGTGNAFMSVFFTALILTAIALGIFGIGWLVLRYLRFSRKGPQSKIDDLKDNFPYIARAWALRLCLIAYVPVVVFALYQWTLKDSWLATLISVISFLAIIGAILYPSVKTILLATRSGPQMLYTHAAHLPSTGPLYAQYHHTHWNFFIPVLLAWLIKALFIAFAHTTGIVQVIALLVVELTLFGALVVLKPHGRKGADALAIFLAVVRILATGLMFAFVESFNVKAIPRVAIGIVIAIAYSIAVVVMFANIFVNLGILQLWTRRFRFQRATRLGSDAQLEKADGGVDGSSLRARSLAALRPRNPTPQHNIPLDPGVNRPYPPTPTTMSLSPPGTVPSTFSGDASDGSGSTTLGSVLPRRPSFEGLGLGFDATESPRSTDYGSAMSSPVLSYPSLPTTRPSSRSPRISASGESALHHDHVG